MTAAGQAGWPQDVTRTVVAWRRAPALPVVALLVAALQQSGSSSPLVLLALVLVGYPCAERLWYLRLWTGRSLAPGELVRALLRCFGRVLRLGLLVGLAFLALLLPVLLVAGGLLVDGTDDLTSGPFPLVVGSWVTLLLAVLYALLVFVLPALAYTTDSARRALGLGLGLLRRSWPSTAAYALVPAAAIGASSLSAGSDGRSPLPVLVLSALVLSVNRGAAAAYYLRAVGPVSPDGSVDLRDRPSYAAPAR